MTTTLKTKLRRPKTAKLRSPVKRQSSRPDLHTLRTRCGISQTLMARLLGVSLRTISAVESGTIEATRVARDFSQISRLCEALAEAMHADFIGTWMNGPNEMLGGLKPVEAIERGKIDLVWRITEGLRSGSQL